MVLQGWVHLYPKSWCVTLRDITRLYPRGVLEVECGNSEPVVHELIRRGHPVEMQEVPLGGCQAIWIDHQRGVLIGGSEPRKDGLALGY